MDNEISKKQFIIISIVVIVITLIVIVSIVNSKNKNDVQVGENNTPIVEENNNMDNSGDEVIIENDEEDNIAPTEPNITYEDETHIEIATTSENLINLQKRIEVTTNDNDENILPEMITLSDEEIEDMMGIDVTLLEDYIIRVSSGKFDVDMYIIAKPTKDNKETVKTQINSFIKAYTNAWSKLGVEQYQLLEDTFSVERKDYLVYIVSTDNDVLMGVVREFIK